jgi:hypothetical protein
MERTAVEWLEHEIFRRYKFTFQQLNCGPLEEAIEQAKEIEQKQKQEIRRTSYMEGYDEGLNDALNK